MHFKNKSFCDINCTILNFLNIIFQDFFGLFVGEGCYGDHLFSPCNFDIIYIGIVGRPVTYSRVRLFQSHWDKKKYFELSEILIIRIHREKRVKKKCGSQISNDSVCVGIHTRSLGLTPFPFLLLLLLLQTLACNISGQNIHTYKQQNCLPHQHSTTSFVLQTKYM